MHLLLAQQGTIADEGEAIDLGQTPGDICVLSAADTELSALAAAQATMPLDAPSLRLANIMRLAHPMSVDRWIEVTGRHAKLVVVRVLGGRSYFEHGLDALHAAAKRYGFSLLALPGDDKPDPGLARFMTIDPRAAGQLWNCLVAGGTPNAAAFLRAAAAAIRGEAVETEATALPVAGIWHDGRVASLDHLTRSWTDGRPVVAITFYRALLLGGQTAAIDALASGLQDEGLNALPVFASSLKDPEAANEVRALLAETEPKVVVNTTGFAVSVPGAEHRGTVLDEGGRVVLQAILASAQRNDWALAARGLGVRDLAMNVALPEIDGRVLSRAIAFKEAGHWDERTQCDLVRHVPDLERVRFTAELARRWATIPEKASERSIAIVLANYPNKDGRIGNGVGLDTPAATVEAMRALANAGYDVGELPRDGQHLLDIVLAGPTNASREGRSISETMSFEAYASHFERLSEPVRSAILDRWGSAEQDPFADGDRLILPIRRFGNVSVVVQPARGYNIDPKETYHSPDLVPPHNYVATYAWLRERVHAVVHMGKHGTLEWLPGKALALSPDCFPEAVFGPMPHVYPFIVNDPGEGTQAKRRSQAVIIDHLTPPLTRAEAHGPMRDLERLVDEYFEASSTDPRRTKLLGREIIDLAHDSGIAEDAGIGTNEVEDDALAKLDGWLCELKELQIRDGLHIFGQSPRGRLRTDLLCALARLPRGGGEERDAGLTRALADDLLDGFDPLDCDMATPWTGTRPAVLLDACEDRWRTCGDTIERLERVAAGLVAGLDPAECNPDDHVPLVPEDGWTQTGAVLEGIRQTLAPAIDQCGESERDGLLSALAGRFVAPGPSGAPTRGRPDVLPTGRNFYSVDTRAVPTRTAWTLGTRSAELVIVRHLQDHGDWPRAIALNCWGTSCMRTGGDDLAQALAFIGATPVWEPSSGRVTGFAIRTLAELGRPRVDVTLRISGFFRDAFPDQIALFDRAARAIGALDEPHDQNPIAETMAAENARMVERGMSSDQAGRRAGYRVFGSKPGAYGAGLQGLIDEGGWNTRAELAEAYMVWGSYAYGAQDAGTADRSAFRTRLEATDAIIQNQDNREHDLLDSDDYYQFEGGMSAAIETLRGSVPTTYHNDHSRPERPVVRTLDEEIARVVRARVTNPKWIAGVMRHGYKGAFEIAATVDYLFAFAATTDAVRSHHFDAVHAAFLEDAEVRDWMNEVNSNALREMTARFAEAIERNLWTPRSNSARMQLNTTEVNP